MVKRFLRYPTVEEIKALVRNLDSSEKQYSNYSPTADILFFLMTTGARIGEVLHAEWPDFDLNEGYWHIRNKPDCPTQDGLGWYPKWHKERSIKLLPVALSVLTKQPRVKTVGYYRDEKGTNIKKAAAFVFPKTQIRIKAACPMMQRKGFYKCIKCSNVTDRAHCGFRTIVHSRCDSISYGWKSLCKKAGVKDLRLHDFRRFFNRVILQERRGFSPEEAGKYIGNSANVNREHYSPISLKFLAEKLGDIRFTESIGGVDVLPN